jgi:ABC-type oligopeptide transport system substrate-binding subunit
VFQWALLYVRYVVASHADFGLSSSLAFPFFISAPHATEVDVQAMERLLTAMIPRSVVQAEADLVHWLERALPLLHWEETEGIELSLLCRSSHDPCPEAVLLDTIREDILVKERGSLSVFRSWRLRLPDLDSAPFFLAYARIIPETERALVHVLETMPYVVKRVVQRLKQDGVRGHKEPFLLSADQQIHVARDVLRQALRRFPYRFDSLLLKELTIFHSLAEEEFLAQRPPELMSKVALSFYAIRKKVMRAVASFPGRRHLSARLFSTQLHSAFGRKKVVALTIAVYHLDEQESFGQKHIEAAVQKWLPDVQIVKGSYYSHKRHKEPLSTIYVELEKRHEGRICLQEVLLLQNELEEELKRRIEKYVPAVFMIRNEEEIMKNVLILSRELKSARDLPQVMVSFDQQTKTDLVFRVVLLRITKEKEDSVSQVLQSVPESFIYFHERTQLVGRLQGKFLKEATCFRLQIPKDSAFTRGDSSINLYLARERIIAILTRAFGHVRDFNGGLLSLQMELFSQFKEAFGEASRKNPDLLEEFFYSITPVEMQALVPLAQLSALFMLVLEAAQEGLPKRDSCFLKIHEDAESVLMVVRGVDQSMKEAVQSALQAHHDVQQDVTSVFVDFHGTPILGYIAPHRALASVVSEAVTQWRQKRQKERVFRVNYGWINPLSLDPRVGGEDSIYITRLLFAGLMRIGKDGRPENALAHSYTVSRDRRQYVFTLKDTYWSDGTQVTAHDFEYAWKKALSPDFQTPFSYFFYPIKHARGVKEGMVASDLVGIKALNDKTLHIELESPFACFLEYLACPLLFPVNRKWDSAHPNWASQGGEYYVCNGPFLLKKRSFPNKFELIKNPLYWKPEEVELDKVLISNLDNETAYTMFCNDELDWLEELSKDASFCRRHRDEIEFGKEVRTRWLVCNTRRFPFNHRKMRLALAHAIDWRAFLEVDCCIIPSDGSPLPSFASEEGKPLFDPERARRLFREVLDEHSLTLETFPICRIAYFSKGKARGEPQIVQKQLEHILGIRCHLEFCEWPQLFSKMTSGDFQLGLMTWGSWTGDPLYTLGAFKHGNDEINFSKWESAEFQGLLDRAEAAADMQERLSFLRLANEILMKEVPVIPLFHSPQRFIRKPCYGHVLFPKNEVIYAKWAHVSKQLTEG